MTDDPKDVAADMRIALSVDDTIQLSCGSWSEFMTKLARAVDHARVLAFRSGIVANNTRRKLNVAEFRGFALSDPIAPAVFVNVRDAKAAQIFTLAHELAHLWIGKSGVSDLVSEIEVEQIANEVERFCDRTAAEFLVPEESFLKRWSRESRDLDQITQSLARSYRVSTTMILRRALELNVIAYEDFFRQLEVERSRQLATQGGVRGGNFRNSFSASNSSLLISAVFEFVFEGRALHREAASVLDVKTSTLSRLAEDYKLAK